jgi:hypothetical protein
LASARSTILGLLAAFAAAFPGGDGGRQRADAAGLHAELVAGAVITRAYGFPELVISRRSVFLLGSGGFPFLSSAVAVFRRDTAYLPDVSSW